MLKNFYKITVSKVIIIRMCSTFPPIYPTPKWDKIIKPCPKDWKGLLYECEANYRNSCGTLTRIFTDAEKTRISNFERVTLPFLWQQAAIIGDLFPDGIRRLQSLKSPETRDSIELNRQQICSLLANMFLGLTEIDEGIMYWCDFGLWLCRGEDFSYCPRDPRLAYANSLLHYFDWIAAEAETRPAVLQETVTFERFAVHAAADVINEERWSKLEVDVDCVKFMTSGTIGANPGKETEIDFANMCIGYGQTATQEEILFGCSPELCVAPLFIPVLTDNESVVIRGAYKICDSTGYGTTLVCSPTDNFDYDVTKRTVLCLDAIDFGALLEEDVDECALLKEQLKRVHIDRELIKLYCGFVNLTSEIPIATGKWGCGVFGGNVLLKLLLQIIAVTACEKNHHLLYYRFADETVMNEAEKLMEAIRGWSLWKLYTFIIQSDVNEMIKFLKQN